MCSGASANPGKSVGKVGWGGGWTGWQQGQGGEQIGSGKCVGLVAVTAAEFKPSSWTQSHGQDLRAPVPAKSQVQEDSPTHWSLSPKLKENMFPCTADPQDCPLCRIQHKPFWHGCIGCIFFLFAWFSHHKCNLDSEATMFSKGVCNERVERAFSQMCFH